MGGSPGLVLLFHCLGSHILARLPVYCAPFALVDLWSFKAERVIGVWSALYQVLLGELGVAKVIIGREEKVKSESLKLKQIL
jgi:hypothetical protein